MKARDSDPHLREQRYEDIQLSVSPIKKDSHEKLLNQPIQHVEGRQLDYANNSIARKDIKITNDLDYLAAGEITDQFCFPKFLTDLGSCCTPCNILCPCCCCPCFPCRTPPLFQQEMTSLGLLQEWGRFKRVLDPGLHVINPISQSVIDINQQTKILQYSQICISKDNVQFQASVAVFYRVFDSLKAAYRLGDLNFQECVIEIANGSLRTIAGQNVLQDIIEKREVLSERFMYSLNQMVNYWGIFIEVCSLKGNSGIIQEIKIAADIQRSLQAVTEAKRLGQALLINYRSQVSCAALFRQIGQLLDTKAAFQIRYLNMVQQILSQNKDNVLIVKTSLNERALEQPQRTPLTLK